MITELRERILITLLLLALTGCATSKPSSPPPPQPVVVPSPPAEIMEPEVSSGSYSGSVLLLLQEWAKKLTAWQGKS